MYLYAFTCMCTVIIYNCTATPVNKFQTVYNMSPEQNLLDLNVDFWHRFLITKSPCSSLSLSLSAFRESATE